MQSLGDLLSDRIVGEVRRGPFTGIEYAIGIDEYVLMTPNIDGIIIHLSWRSDESEMRLIFASVDANTMTWTARMPLFAHLYLNPEHYDAPETKPRGVPAQLALYMFRKCKRMWRQFSIGLSFGIEIHVRNDSVIEFSSSIHNQTMSYVPGQDLRMSRSLPAFTRVPAAGVRGSSERRYLAPETTNVMGKIYNFPRGFKDHWNSVIVTELEHSRLEIHRETSGPELKLAAEAAKYNLGEYGPMYYRELKAKERPGGLAISAKVRREQIIQVQSRMASLIADTRA